MGNCLVTKLKGVVNNDNLPYLNEFCLSADQSKTECRAYLRSIMGTQQRVFITGDSDAWLEYSGSNVGRDLTFDTDAPIILHKNAGTAVLLHIENAYSQLKAIQRVDTDGGSFFDFKVTNPEKVKYCQIDVLNVLGNQGFVGDLKELFPSSTLSAVISIYDETSSFTGDMSIMPNSFKWFSIGVGTQQPFSKFTWKNQRPDTAYIISMENADFGDDLDAMLINQARCVAAPIEFIPYFGINCSGNRTSASDAAVATLKSKGYVVKVNGEPL